MFGRHQFTRMAAKGLKIGLLPCVLAAAAALPWSDKATASEAQASNIVGQLSACGNTDVDIGGLLYMAGEFRPTSECHAPTMNAMGGAAHKTFAAVAANVLPAQFPTGGWRLSEHDGFKATFNPTFQTPSSEISEISSIVTAEINLTKHLNLAMGRTLRVGTYVGFDKLDANIETNAFLASLGIRRVGDANNDSVMIGGYALYTMGTAYLLTITGIDFGETDTDNFLTGFVGSYDTFGIVTGTAIGKVFTLSQRMGGMKDAQPTRAVKLDIRGGLTYSHHEANSYTEFNWATGANGLTFGAAEVDVFAGSVSATLFMDIQKANGNLWRPFVKVGIKHRFAYDNTLILPAQTVAQDGAQTTLANAVKFNFEDDDTFWNVEGGMQIATTKRMTLNGSVYYEGSGDIDTIGGRLGVKWALN